MAGIRCFRRFADREDTMTSTAGSPIAVEGLAEVVLNVRDMHRSLAFYRDILGLAVVSPPERTNPVFLRAGSATDALPALVVLVQLPADAAPFTPPRTLHHLALAVSAEGFDAAHEALARQRLTIRTGQHPILPSRTMYVDDPDGNEVEFIAPA
jgi:catechol-2,3-dioxygenase